MRAADGRAGHFSRARSVHSSLPLASAAPIVPPVDTAHDSSYLGRREQCSLQMNAPESRWTDCPVASQPAGTRLYYELARASLYIRYRSRLVRLSRLKY